MNVVSFFFSLSRAATAPFTISVYDSVVGDGTEVGGFGGLTAAFTVAVGPVAVPSTALELAMLLSQATFIGVDRSCFRIIRMSCIRFVSSSTYDSMAAARNLRFSSLIGIAVDGPLVPSVCARLHFKSALYIGIFSIVAWNFLRSCL